MTQKKVLFVCLGNICRSPTAEGVFRSLLEDEGLTEKVIVDSCGTSAYHIGSPPHEESRRTAAKNGVHLDGQRARRLEESDFDEFDYIIAMDSENKADIEDLDPGGKAKVFLLRDFDPEKDSPDVPDPYFGGRDGFGLVFRVIDRSCRAFLEELKKEL